MSRDRDPRERASPPCEAGDRALLGAYVDGVAELAPDERRAVEAVLAGDPDARSEAAAVRGVLDQLRALPPEGTEPDWAAMERSIDQAVRALPVRPWWRAWRWWMPAMTCAAAAAVLFAVWPPEREPSPAATPATGVASDHPERLDGVVPLWLDGNEVDVDVDLVAAGEFSRALGEPEPTLDDELGEAVPGAPLEATAGAAPEPPSEATLEATSDEIGVLPARDLAWVDRLDEAALARAERWLDGGKG